MLANPIGIIRAALNPGTRLSKLRRLDGVLAMDVTSADGDLLTLGVNRATNLPEWVSCVQPNAYLGDLTLRTYFVGYQLENGVQVPSGYTTVSDFRNVFHEKLDVARAVIDAPSDLIDPAPQSVRATQPPANNPTVSVEVVPIARGIWYLKGQGNSTAFEFSDHITLFEPFGSPANMTAILEKARALVPGKPVTQIIASHSHLDHNGGLRTAVAEGLEVIAHRNAVELFRELVARPAKHFPDALGRNPKPLKIIPVDEKLVLKDAAMEVHVLRVMRNNHMADALFAYVPSEKIVAQGDLFDEGWELVWWGNSYPDSVRYWNIDVDTDLAVHGNANPYSRVLELLRKQAASAKRFCDTAERDDYMVPGCPTTNVDF
jgi:glyoxylase-like metal-dependent hydrolase (beta-lactamase superfamily II)